jgi:hypothetical protein
MPQLRLRFGRWLSSEVKHHGVSSPLFKTLHWVLLFQVQGALLLQEDSAALARVHLLSKGAVLSRLAHEKPSTHSREISESSAAYGFNSKGDALGSNSSWTCMLCSVMDSPCLKKHEHSKRYKQLWFFSLLSWRDSTHGMVKKALSPLLYWASMKIFEV